MISIAGVAKAYEKHVLFADVSLDIEPGSIVGIKGFSGSGKTTLLHIAGGLEAPDVGKIFIDGCEAHSVIGREKEVLWRETIGFVFQDAWLIPEFLVWENVALKGFAAGWSLNDSRNRALELLVYLDLSGFADRTIQGLSGGEKQRIALARALFLQPKYLLADEPTSALDDRAAQQFILLVQQAVADYNLGALIVSHDQRVYEYMHKIYYFLDGQLRLV